MFRLLLYFPLGLTDTSNPSILFSEIKAAAVDEQRQRLNDNYDKLNDSGKKELVRLSGFMLGNPDYLKEANKDNQNVS